MTQAFAELLCAIFRHKKANELNDDYWICARCGYALHKRLFAK